MELEKQVCSLELAKRLKELGLKQDSMFDWVLNNDPEYYLFLMSPYNRQVFKFKDQYSAFTVAELGEALQWEELHIFGTPKEFLVYIDGKNTEVDARAKMLIYLLEKESIKNGV